MSDIVDYLERAYVGARGMGDSDAMTRIARAIAAIEAPTDMEIFNAEFREWHLYQTFKPQKRLQEIWENDIMTKREKEDDS